VTRVVRDVAQAGTPSHRRCDAVRFCGQKAWTTLPSLRQKATIDIMLALKRRLFGAPHDAPTVPEEGPSRHRRKQTDPKRVRCTESD
jgi:hypothetical protein